MMKRLFTSAILLVWGLCVLGAEKSGTVVYINGSKYYVHTVRAGETIYSLAREYKVGEKVILENNPSAANGLKADESIKIPFVAEPEEPISEKKLLKTFNIYFVSKGETLYSISRKYQIPIQTIVADNPNLDPIHLRLGERLLIRKRDIGSETEAETKAQWEEYRDKLNSVADTGYSYHMVNPGETFYSLSHRFEISEAELSALNAGLKAADLKAGAIIKVPGMSQPEDPTQSVVESVESPLTATPKQVDLRALSPNETLEVALLLPMEIDGEANANYLDFYKGFLLGMKTVKQKYGYSANVGLYNTGRSPEKIVQIVENPDFRKTQLIVGPVYEDGLPPVLRFGEEHGVPVVSPLANITGMGSDVLFQLSPAPARKYEKVADLIAEGKRITLIYSGTTDREFEQEMLAMLGSRPYAKHNYKYAHPSTKPEPGGPSDLTPLLDNGEDNLFVILSDNEVDVERILAALASADTSLTGRGRTAPRYRVLGNARWNRYNNLDREVFFKDRVVLISTYHAKRDSQMVTDFDSEYIRSFGSLPSLFSYRGYDAAVLFCPAMYGEIERDLGDQSYTPLQTTYTFSPSEGGTHTNQNWMRVNYNSDFTITIE